jgi:hypothetical protein
MVSTQYHERAIIDADCAQGIGPSSAAETGCVRFPFLIFTIAREQRHEFSEAYRAAAAKSPTRA